MWYDVFVLSDYFWQAARRFYSFSRRVACFIVPVVLCLTNGVYLCYDI
jgi:hypothetical protein